MANDENLIPLNKRTKSEQRKITSSGGKKSAENRRNKKLLKDYMNILLDLPVVGADACNEMGELGIPFEEYDNRMRLVTALFKKAVDGYDVQAIKEIRNLIGEDKQEDNSGNLENLIKGLKNNE